MTGDSSGETFAELLTKLDRDLDLLEDFVLSFSREESAILQLRSEERHALILLADKGETARAELEAVTGFKLS